MFMKMRWPIVFVLAVTAIAVLMLLGEKHASAGPPQGAAVAPSGTMTMKASEVSGPLSIPDTTSAINSEKPMSQRVVHYEIDARYDPAKHVVDGNEILTYHNLTGETLDH